MYETISPLEAIKKVGSSYGGISDEQAAEKVKTIRSEQACFQRQAINNKATI